MNGKGNIFNLKVLESGLHRITIVVLKRMAKIVGHCGGGMDLSQDIALSYVWLERWIPEDFISRVCKQKNLSVYGENFIYLRNAIIEQTEVYKNRFEQLKEDWTNKE